MPSKYFHRRVTPAEFMKLRNDANIGFNDFLYLTGRYAKSVRDFAESSADGTATANLKWIPTMGDVLVLELAARFPPTKELMMQIADEYSLGAPGHEIEKGAKIKEGGSI